MVLLDASFWKAAALGFSVAAPIGPVGVLCMSRSLGGGAFLGLATGLGAATAQVVWVLVAALSFAASALADPGVATVLSLAAALLMMTTGVLLTTRGRAPPSLYPAVPCPAASRHAAVFGAYLSGALVAAASPTTLLLFLTAVPALIPPDGTGADHAATMAAGAFFGSTLWWVALSTATAALRGRLGGRAMRLVNWTAGGVLIGLAVLLLARAVPVLAGGAA